MKVTLKLKTLVTIVSVVMVAFSALLFVLPLLKNVDGATKEIPWEDPLQLFLLAMESAPDNTGRITVFPSYSSSGGIEPTITTEEGIEYFEYLIHNYPKFVAEKQEVYWNLAQLYLRKDDINTAIHYLKKVKMSSSYHYRNAQTLLSILQPDPMNESKIPSLTGTVWIGDKPAPNMLVMLNPYQNNGWTNIETTRYYPMALTDENGEYRFYDVLPENYEVGVSFFPEQVSGYYLPIEHGTHVTIEENKTVQYDIQFVSQIKVNAPINHEVIEGDTIRFSWEPHPGADHYKVGLTMFFGSEDHAFDLSTMTSYLQGEWVEPFAEYTVDEIREMRSAIYKSGDADTSYLSPSSILGLLYPGGQFSWLVEAYDAEGNRLSSSAGYYLNNRDHLPLFSTSDEKQLEGDRYVLQLDYEKAIESYENEGANPYALRALARMYFYGLTIEDQGDKQKALEYLLKIEQPSETDLRMIAEAYVVLGEFEKAKEIYLNLIDTGKSSWGDFAAIGDILAKQGDRQGAIEYYEKVHQFNSDNDRSERLVLLYLLEKDYDKALYTAQHNPYKYYTKDLYPLLAAVGKQGWENQQFAEVLQALLEEEIEIAKRKIAQFSKDEQVYVDFLNALGYELFYSAFDDPSLRK